MSITAPVVPEHGAGSLNQGSLGLRQTFTQDGITGGLNEGVEHRNRNQC